MNNPSLSNISDEFFNILANFDRPIVMQLKGIYKQESDRLTDEDILKFLTDFRKPPTLAKKPKTIPGDSSSSSRPLPSIQRLFV